jgi:hypothetical protein
MKDYRFESGQALVGTLVIMVLVFAMAGSVALAASSLLDRQTSHQGAISTDLRTSDALTAAVAHVAGRGLQAQPTCATASPATFSTILPGGFNSSVSCLRFDEVTTPDVGAVALTWAGGCATVPLPSGVRSRSWVFFGALAGAGLAAWVDGQAGCDPRAAERAECRFSSTATVALAAMDCDLAEIGSQPILHVVNPLSSPAAARFVTNGTPPAGGDEGGATPVDTTGSIYVLAATTGLTAGPQFEEGAVFVSRDGAATALLSEETP